ncbi:MAG TPA: type II toxin-antitoxin system VapC family toxin [Candidatus Binatia bacterium]|nr:type II toxin-antitoxin system VapC family toxin [Candidatus Binatia bacterium]
MDTNVIVALWSQERALSGTAQSALDRALAQGGLVISAPVCAELMAAPARDSAFLDSFLRETGVVIDWKLNEAVWRASGAAFQKYAIRRRQQHLPGPRRILADFLIGAHAAVLGYRLLTLDDRLYRAAFPGLRLIPV